MIVDLHIHSHYSRATSRDCNLEGLYKWGKIKGINIIGTGDFTHPAWFAELQEKLEPAEPGLYRLREDLAQSIDAVLPQSVRNNMIRFILTVEISNIYSKGGKVRKLHNVLVAPSYESVALINARLARIGNLKADGRPILGLDSKELLRITLATDRRMLFVPAHIWTPWFAMFGSKSGFNSIEEAFEELTPEIKAVETGLSSDPFMNWRLKQLKDITILSNSDAHSPQKLGREATVLNLNNKTYETDRSHMSYDNILDAIRTNDERIVGTIEFFPQEGKYHFDGHRACKIRFTPEETKKNRGVCPVCHAPLTVGVDYRVGELANHPESYKPKSHKRVEYIIPLIEILSEIEGVKTATKKVWSIYDRVYSALGNEFDILRNIPQQDIAKAGFSSLADAVGRMRKGEIYVDPGYDGVYGVIKVYGSKAQRQTSGEQLLFDLA